MAFVSTAVSFPPLLTTAVLHIRSDAGNPSADPRRTVSELIETTGRAMSARLQSHARGPPPGASFERIEATDVTMYLQVSSSSSPPSNFCLPPVSIPAKLPGLPDSCT